MRNDLDQTARSEARGCTLRQRAPPRWRRAKGNKITKDDFHLSLSLPPSLPPISLSLTLLKKYIKNMARSIYLHFGPCAEILLPSFFTVLVVVDEMGPAARRKNLKVLGHTTQQLQKWR